MVNIVSFPGLGLGPFTLDRVAFNIFGRDFYWYGIIIGLAYISGLAIGLWQCKRLKANTDRVIDAVLIATPAAIIGARLYYVLMSGQTYDSFYRVIAIWDGGVAIYGGIIGALLAVFIYCRIKKTSVFEIMDVAAAALILGQAIGRWGNFINVEAFGTETTLPWRMQIMTMSGTMEVHPTFLYESLWNILGFALIMLYSRRRKFKGELFFVYMGWYGFGRAIIEGLRTDSLFLGPVRISQILGGLFFGASVVLIILGRRRARIKAEDEKEYEPVFGGVGGFVSDASEASPEGGPEEVERTGEPDAAEDDNKADDNKDEEKSTEE